jgi:dephospho-CoA kinase
MLKVGLTGNIGSGKTTVAKLFTQLGVPVYYADDAAKRFLQDPQIIHDLIDLFGKDILSPSGTIDRKALAETVFQDSLKLKILNGLIHPKVMNDFRAWCQRNNTAPYIIQEAAIIYESGIAEEFDKIIHVSSSDEISIERVIKRDDTSREAAENRMRMQWSNDKKSQLADFVIHNDGSQLVIPQVLEIHRQLTG